MLMLLCALAALAGSLGVDPIRVELRDSSALMEVSAAGDAPLQVQITPYAWSILEDGRSELTPTQDVTVFPSLLALEPGSSRKVRISGPRAGTTEQAYRLVVEELPSTDRGPGVSLVTRMSVPVYVVPRRVVVDHGISAVTASSGEISYDLWNGGTIRWVAERVVTRGFAADGSLRFDRVGGPDVVFARTRRRVQHALPPNLCAELAVVEIEASGQQGVIVERVVLPAGACGR